MKKRLQVFGAVSIMLLALLLGIILFPSLASIAKENPSRDHLIATGSRHTLAIKEDGTVVVAGNDYSNQCAVQDWNHIISVATGTRFSVGLKEDGTVVATGENEDKQCDVEDWKDIVAISAGENHTVGLKQDGRWLQPEIILWGSVM